MTAKGGPTARKGSLTAADRDAALAGEQRPRFAPEEIAEHLAELDDRAEKFSFGLTRYDYMYGSSADIIRYLRDRAAKLDAALNTAKEFIEDHVDVVDGDYGVPAPNRAMSVMNEINEILGVRP